MMSLRRLGSCFTNAGDGQVACRQWTGKSVISVAILHTMLFAGYSSVLYCWENVQQMLVNTLTRVSQAVCVCVCAFEI